MAGCSSCGGGTKSARVEVSNIVMTDTPMRQFIDEQGWKLTGNCGCRNNLNVYVTDNPKWTGYEVWMNINATRLEVRRKFGRDTKILGIGYTNNYQQIYFYHLPK